MAFGEQAVNLLTRGHRLIAEAERQAFLAGKRRMTLYTNALMVRNIVLYLKLGYRETSRRPNTARPGFTIVDMEKCWTTYERCP